MMSNMIKNNVLALLKTAKDIDAFELPQRDLATDGDTRKAVEELLTTTKKSIQYGVKCGKDLLVVVVRT